MNAQEPVSLSRATSRASRASRGSRHGSTMSRNQSLIKKNIELQDLKPADVLIERFVAWKAIVKQLTAYFEGIADIENNTAKEMVKLAGVIQVPFRSGNQFLGEGGLQDVFYSIRDKTRVIADQHANLGRTIDSSIVQHLQKLGAEIKAHIKNVQNDTGKLAAGVAKEREISTKLVGELANSISMYKNTPMSIPARSDPYIANQAVARQLQRQVLEENLLQKSIVIMQQNSAHFEEGIVRSIQSAWQTFDEWQTRASAASQEIYRALAVHMASLTPDREWIAFAARADHLLDPETPLRDPELIQYPLKDDSSVVSVHTGHLERKQNFTRAYKEGYYVLTPAGFLHEFSTSDVNNPASQVPTFSIFLPNCTLGPASAPNAKSHKFHIEGRKDGTGTTKAGGFKSFMGGDSSRAWSFRARSHTEMMEWWNDVRMLCARYLVASEMVERSGPVEAAVRAAGYISGEDEYDEEDEEGSSIEEEQEEGMDIYQEVEDPPGYTHTHTHTKHYPVEIGPNGYAVEKKQSIGQGHGSGGYDEHDAPAPIVGGDLNHRSSKRQQEKAPEGRLPHVNQYQHVQGEAYDHPVSNTTDDEDDGAVMDRGPASRTGVSTTTATPMTYQRPTDYSNNQGQQQAGDGNLASTQSYPYPHESQHSQEYADHHGHDHDHGDETGHEHEVGHNHRNHHPSQNVTGDEVADYGVQRGAMDHQALRPDSGNLGGAEHATSDHHHQEDID